MHISGTEKFRRVALFGSLIFGAMSAIIMVSNVRNCETIDLKLPTYITFSVQLTIFVLLMMHYIHLGSCIKAMGQAIGLYYVYLVAAMIIVQIFVLKADGCNRTSPLLYYWLVTNIGLFYVFIAYGLSLWGAYICWEQEEEEKVHGAALKQYLRNNYDNKQMLLEAGYRPPSRALMDDGPNPIDVEMQNQLKEFHS